MRFLTKLILIVLVLTQLAGCVSGVIAVATQAQMSENAELADAIALGSSRTEILGVFGEPQKIFRNQENGIT